jgi:hypothetical protein
MDRDAELRIDMPGLDMRVAAGDDVRVDPHGARPVAVDLSVLLEHRDVVDVDEHALLHHPDDLGERDAVRREENLLGRHAAA